MQHDITKLCTAALRVDLDTKHGIKLKSGHAHEIGAAVFGYKSRMAMLADKKYPISNLPNAEIIVLDPSTSLVDQRLKSLEGLPSGLPPSSVLVEGIYSVIRRDQELSTKIRPSLRELALFLAEEHLNQEMNMWRMDPKALSLVKDVSIQQSETEVLMTVSFGYRTDAGESHRYRKYVIHLPRIAANVGYGKPELAPTLYTGGAKTHSDEELLKKYPVQL